MHENLAARNYLRLQYNYDCPIDVQAFADMGHIRYMHTYMCACL